MAGIARLPGDLLASQEGLRHGVGGNFLLKMIVQSKAVRPKLKTNI